MKKLLASALAAVAFLVAAPAHAVFLPVQGGTGTTTAPAYGQVLVGDGHGNYGPAATSSLGISGGGGGSGVWGAITGTLSSQTDLQNALNLKLDASAFGSLFYSFFHSTTTDALSEGASNLYWTPTRFDNRLSATTTLPSITTLANLGTIKTSISGVVKAASGVLSAAGSSDIITALGFTPYNATNPSGFISNITSLISQGTNVTITGAGTGASPYVINAASGSGGAIATSSNLTAGLLVQSTGVSTIANIATSSLGLLTTNVAEGSNQYFTNARAIAAPITGYVSGAGVVAATDSVLQAIQKLNGNAAALVTGVSSVFGRTGAVTAQSGDYNTSQVTENTNLYYTAARDTANFISNLAATTSVASITALPNLSLPASQLTNFGVPFYTFFHATTTDALTEGSTNLYFTNARADARFVTDLAATTSVSSITALPNLGTIKTTLSGLVKSASGVLTAAVNGTDFTLVTANTCSAGQHVSQVTAAGVITCSADTGTTYTATYPILVTGSVISTAFGTTSSNSYAGTQTFNNPIVDGTLSGLIAGNSGTTYAAATSTLTATGPLTGSFTQVGTGGALGIQVANTSQNGYLSSTDWNTFNGKLSSAITSIGPVGQTQTGATQLLASSTAGTDFTITASGNTQTFNLPTASATNRGALSSTDWSTFNGKQAAGSYITALTGDITASGPGSVGATLATVNTNVGSFTNANVTVNAKGLVTAVSNGTAPTTYTGTYPIQVSGSAISTAFGTTTSNLFGGTQTFTNSPVFSTLTAGTVNATAGGTVYSTATSSVGIGLGLSYSGTMGSEIGGTSGTLTIATSSLYSGTTGQFPYFNATNSLTGTSSIFLSPAGNVGIATAVPVNTLDINGNIAANNANSVLGFSYIGANLVNSGVGSANVDTLVVGTTTGGNGARGVVSTVHVSGGTGGTGATAQAINGFSTIDPTVLGNVTTALASGGGARSRYLSNNSLSGYNALAISGISANTNTSGLLASTTDQQDFNAENLVVATNDVVTNGYGLHVLGGTTPGTITTHYGVKVEDLVSGTNRYAFYQAGASDMDYFAGSVGVGSTTPGSIFSIGNTGGINFTLGTTTFSTTGGINITNGCYAFQGTCLSTGGSSITGTAGFGVFINAAGTAAATSSIFISPNGRLSVGTTTSSNGGLNLIDTNSALGVGKDNIVLGGNPGGDTDFWFGRYVTNDSTDNDFLQWGKGLVPGTTPLMTLAGTGNLGIGTTSPFTLVGVSGPTPIVTIADTATNGLPYEFRGGANFPGDFDLYDVKNKVPAFYWQHGVSVPQNGMFIIGSTSNAISGNNSRLFVYGGGNGANIDTMGDYTQNGGTGDTTSIEAEGSDYNNNGANVSSISMRYYGPAFPFGTILGYPQQRIGILDFGQASTSIISTGVNTIGANSDLHFGVGYTEAMTLAGTLRLGIGSTTPFAKLGINSASSTLWPFAISTTTGKTIQWTDAKGNQYTGGDVPVVSSCGTTPVIASGSNNNTGRVKIGSGVVSSCLVTFADAGWASTANAPACTADAETILTSDPIASSTPTSVTITATGMAGAFITYNCRGF